MKKITSIFLLLFIGWNVSAQENISESGFAGLMNRNDIAQYSIFMLKEGTLLVRLNTSNKQLELLEKMGLTERYAEVKAEQEKENISIVSAFNNKMKYPKQVYFFYSEHTSKVLNRKFDEILLDEQLIPVDTNTIGNNFFIADFSRTENLGIPALVIYDSGMNQMPPPFPYYARTFESLPIFDRGHDRTVEILNTRLFLEFNR